MLEVSGNLACGALDGRPLAKAVAVVPGLLQSQNWTARSRGAEMVGCRSGRKS